MSSATREVTLTTEASSNASSTDPSNASEKILTSHIWHDMFLWEYKSKESTASVQNSSS